MKHSVAVVTIAYGRREHLGRQQQWLLRHAPGIRHVVVDMGGSPVERSGDTVVVDLAIRADGPLPLAAARNLGARASGADVLVFLDVDCLPGPAVIDTYLRNVEEFGGVWSGPVGYLPLLDDVEPERVGELVALARFHDGRPVPGQNVQLVRTPDLFWSLSFAVRACEFYDVGGFDETFVGYGAEDTDFARTVAASGLDLWFEGDAIAFHQHHPVSTPPVEHLDDIVANASRFYEKWGDWPMQTWLQEFAARGLIEWTHDAEEIRWCVHPTG